MEQVNQTSNFDKFLEFVDAGSYESRDYVQYQNNAYKVLSDVLQHNTSELTQYLSAPSNQATVIEIQLADQVMDQFEFQVQNPSEESVKLMEAVASANPYAFYANNDVQTNSDSPNPAVDTALALISDENLKTAAAHYSPDKLSSLFYHLPNDKKDLMVDLLEISIKNHPNSLVDTRHKNAFQENLKALTVKFPDLKDQFNSIQTEMVVGDCNVPDVQTKQDTQEPLTNVASTRATNDPLADTGLSWKYQDGGAVLDVTEFLNKKQSEGESLADRLYEQHNNGNLQSFTIAPDSEGRTYLRITPDSVDYLHDQGKKAMQEVGAAIKGVAPEAHVAPVTTSAAETQPTTVKALLDKALGQDSAKYLALMQDSLANPPKEAVQSA